MHGPQNMLANNTEITKEMIEQARNQVWCLIMAAHHEWSEEQSFDIDDDGLVRTFVIWRCDCGATEIHPAGYLP